MMRSRFAPSPNGLLHLGHAYAAICAHDLAREQGGEFWLRIEDIDGERSRPEFVQAIIDDLRWLGLDWDRPPVFQSDRIGQYDLTHRKLCAEGLIYPCFCSRSAIIAANAAQNRHSNAPQTSAEVYTYPGTCRNLDPDIVKTHLTGEPHCWRLDMAAATARTGPLVWRDRDAGEQIARPEQFGDVILFRRDAPASYHLSATLDDAHDAITHIVRGRDLFAATHIHRLLQALLGLPTPQYWHHSLLAGPDGRKLSKSIGSAALANLRESGVDGTALADALRKNQLPAGISWLTS